MPQANVYALMALASFVAALLTARLWAKITRGDLPGGHVMAFYLRMLVGFLLTASIVFGYRSF